MDRINQTIKLYHISNELMVMMQRLEEIHTSIKDNTILKDQSKIKILENINFGCKFIAEAYSEIFEDSLKELE